jgi:putative ABC transport system permease protein
MRLPLLARLLLWLTDPAVREFVAGDLEEGFAARASADGELAARRWAARQAIGATLSTPWRPRRRPGVIRGDGFMKTMMQDLRYGARMVRKQPGYSLVVVLTLALAIGANSVIFSIASLLAIRPLPLANERSLGWIFSIDPQTGNARAGMSVPEFLDYRGAVTSFSSLAATYQDSVTMTGRGDAERLAASRVTANLIETWGLKLAQGRTFSTDADRPGALREVILSHHFWKNRLGGQPGIVGQSLTLDGQPATVVGVLAPDIEIGNLADVDVWTPIELRADGSRLERRLRVTGRLRPGVTVAQASAEVREISNRMADAHRDTNAGWTARVAPTREAMTGTDTWTVLALLGAVVGFILMIACANLANLVLSRGLGRRRELAVRTALGASRARVVRQMLTENVLYGVAGGALGLLFAQGGLVLMRAVVFDRIFDAVVIDRNVLAFTAVLAILTPILFGLLPALQSSRSDVNEALKDGGARSGGGVRARRSRAILVVAQLGLAVTLLVVSALLVQALMKIEYAPVGFDADRLLSFQVDPPAWRYGNDPAVLDYYDRLLARVRATTGVRSATVTDRLPLLGSEAPTLVEIAGRPSPRAEDRPWAVPVVVDEGYFTTLGVPIVSGRGILLQDTAETQAVAVVNREMARRFWQPADRAIGARVTVGGGAAARAVQIVGIAGDVLKGDREGPNPQIYLPVRQSPRRDLVVMARSDDPRAIQAAVREQARALDADVPVYLMRPVRQALNEDLSDSHVLGGMFAAFALIALVLAASGLYAVISYSVGQRVQEFGVRIALGAVPGDIQRMVFRQTAVLVAIGLVLGLAGGRLLATGASSLLYRVSPSDPPTYAGVAAILGLVALCASIGPVRRACRIDPVRALRLE